MSDETGPKNLVEREEGLSRGAGPPFQGQIFLCVHRQLTAVSGKQNSLVIFPQNVKILKAGKKIKQHP